MPDKNPAADRWGGVGGGENTKHPRPEPMVEDSGDVDDADREDDSPATGAPE